MKPFAILAFFAASVGVFAIQQKPSDTPKQGVASDKKGGKAQKTGESGNAQQPSSDGAVVVNQTYTTETPSSGDKEREEIKIQRDVLGFTCVLAVAGILQFLVLLGTFWLMRDTARRQLRAYVCFESGFLKFAGENSRDVEAHVGIKNYGQTPAHNVKHWVRAQVVSYPLREELPKPPPNIPVSASELPPNERSLAIERPEGRLGKEPIVVLGITLQRTVCVYGRIEYTDVFGKPWHGEYRLIYGGGGEIRKGRMEDGSICRSLQVVEKYETA